MTKSLCVCTVRRITPAFSPAAPLLLLLLLFRTARLLYAASWLLKKLLSSIEWNSPFCVINSPQGKIWSTCLWNVLSWAYCSCGEGLYWVRGAQVWVWALNSSSLQASGSRETDIHLNLMEKSWKHWGMMLGKCMHYTCFFFFLCVTK